MSRSAALLASALLASCFACSEPPTRAVPDRLDLHPLAASGTDDGQRGRVKLMAETKTHRLVFSAVGEPLRFEDVEAPGRVRFSAELQLLDLPTKSRHPLQAELVATDERGDVVVVRSPVKTQLEDGRRWIPLELELDAPRGLRELSLTLEREDFAARPQGRFVLLRPHLRFERRVPLPDPELRRQIVLVTTDTLRADVLGCYGNEEVATPALDRLAGDSARFTRAFATSNVTNPSHTSIFTSLYLKDHGVRDNFTKLAPEVPTMLEPLRDEGFLTAAFVSSFNFQPEKSDLDRRFDEFFPCTTYFERRAEDVNLDALPWFTAHADEDFFVWLHYFDAHMPYAPPWPYNRMYSARDEGQIELPIDYKGNLNWFSNTREAGWYRAMYHGEVSYLDHHLGELFEHLEALGVYDDATIVLTSDHGESLGEHGVFCDHATLFDEVTRVPLLVKQPTHMRRAGPRVVDAFVSGVDLYPTLFDLYDLDVPNGVRGRSLVPWLRGGEAIPASGAFSTFARGLQSSLRTDGHRYSLGLETEQLFPAYGVEAGRRELFSVTPAGAVEDVTETEPDLARRHHEELSAFLADELDHEALPIGEEFIDAMESLGYTGDDD